MAGALQPATVFAPPASDDPFVSTPPIRHGAFDPESFSTQTGSSKQARLKLEAHLKETDRRIQDASKLGSTLVQQRKQLSARLKELSERPDSEELGPDLKKKLEELEREYTDVGRETARAVLPKSRLVSDGQPDIPPSPAVFSGMAGSSPSKLAAPSRKQRNTQSNRVHDIEFATEISTSLLAQVRTLQAALAEKDEALKTESAEKAALQEDHTSMRARLRHLDDNEQKYKDENWNLETQLQDLHATIKAAAEREHKAGQTLKATQLESDQLLRELEDLRQSHGQLSDDIAASKRAHEAELYMLKKDLANYDTERDQVQRQIDDLMAQNAELTRALSYRMNNESRDQETHGAVESEEAADRDALDLSPPPSPTKRAAGGMLETETLRSSLQHAHRMIQTLKNNIHREKTEKLELKRLLQDARDDLESKRGDNKLTGLKKRRSELNDAKSRKIRADQLGSHRVSREEILNDPDWEDYEGQDTLRSSTVLRPRRLSMPGAYAMTEESSDNFETANEKDTTSTETEAFETTHEGFDEDNSGSATETEGHPNRASGIKQRYVSMSSIMRRASYRSTASTSADEEVDSISTPLTAQQKYKVKNLKSRTSFRDSMTSSNNNSPAMSAIYRNSPAFSQASNRSTPVNNGQTLGDELDGLSDEDSVMTGTPSRVLSMASASSPSVEARARQAPRPSMVDSGMMTEPWEPEQHEEKSQGLLAAAAGAAGAVGGLVTGAILGNKHGEDSASDVDSAVPLERSITPTQATVSHSFSAITSVGAAPVELPQPEPVPVPEHTFARTVAQSTQPVMAVLPQPTYSFTPVATQHNEPRELPKPEPAPAPVHSFAPLSSQHHAPRELPQPEPVPVPLPVHGFAQVSSLHTQPTKLPQPEATPAPIFGYAPTSSQHTAPEQLPVPEPVPAPAHGFAAINSWNTEPRELAQPAPSPAPIHEFAPVSTQHNEPRDLPQAPVVPLPVHSYSGVSTQSSEPMAVPAPELDHNFSSVQSHSTEPTEATRAEVPQPTPALQLSRSKISSQHTEPQLSGWLPAAPAQPATSTHAGAAIAAASFAGGIVSEKIFDDLAHTRDLQRDQQNRLPFAEISNNASTAQRSTSVTGRSTRGRSFTERDTTSNEGDPLLKNKNIAVTGSGVEFVVPGPSGRPTANMSSPRMSSESSAMKRPPSVNSLRNRSDGVHPPLPVDHSTRISQATSRANSSAMGPPLMPASAYRVNQRAPSVQSRTSTVNTVTKVGSMRHNNTIGRTQSRRSSVSSFASEVDHRLNPMGQFAYPSDLPVSTDPRMIAAITQTMIGEYLWKYTRSPLSAKTLSSNRHRRFFWVHPYTRTLYWSESDPATSSKAQHKAKSVAIESVRVTADDNAFPPGLYQKSIVVVTPAREIVFTAPTSQRHETWFNALSYLLMRTDPNAPSTAASTHSMTPDELNDEDIAEFNPAFRAASSLSVASRTWIAETPTLTHATVRADNRSPSRKSIFGSKSRASFSSARSRGKSIAGADEARREIEDAEMRDRLENVRACCDGKHDVGSLHGTRRGESTRSRHMH